jgi:hypothetical protein
MSPAATPGNAVPLQAGDLVDDVVAAAILGIEVRTLRNWRGLGKGPRFRKIGERIVRYHRADLAAFVAGEPSAA